MTRCKECITSGPWRFDDDGNTIGKCRDCYPPAAPDTARDDGLAATTDANPEALKAALAIIRETALTHDRFSSNVTRHRMSLAQVPGPVVGAAFRQAAVNRWIRADSYEPSTDPGTHAHPVRTWVSLIYNSRRTA